MRQKWQLRHQVHPADLNLPQSDAVTQLKSKTNGGTCFMQEQHQSVFVLEAKTAPKKWQAIQTVYPLDDLPTYYLKRNEAAAAKAALKTLLLGKWKNRVKKYPIRVRETLEGSSSNIKKMKIS